MRQSDRLLYIIYRTLNQSIIDLNEANYNLSDEKFISKIKFLYQQKYPENYNGDELDVIIEYQNQLIYEKYGSSNPIYLMFFYSEKIFEIHNDEILVLYEYLLEWNGYQNKIDGNIFIAAFAAINTKEELLQESKVVLRHNNKRLYAILDKGISEGHMHLKGSGQTTELSWNEIIKLPLFYNKGLIEFIKKDTNFLKLKSEGYTIDSILLMILKLKLIRLLLSLSDDSDGVSLELCKQLSEIVFINDLSSLKKELLDIKKEIDKLNSEQAKKITELEKNKASLPERLFYYAQFCKILDNVYPDDSIRMKLLHYYIWGSSVVKFEFYQDNIGMGFQKFKRLENNKDDLLNNNDIIYRSVFQKYYEEGNVNKVEMRIAPKQFEEFQKMIVSLDNINQKVYQDYLKKNPNLKKIEYAIVIHYIKDDTLSSCVSNNDYERFYKFHNIVKQDYKLVSKTLLYDQKKAIKNSNYQRKIVGLDAANTEVNTPPEIFAPYFRKHREDYKGRSSLYLTYHVGEEFRNLEAGLRYIDNTIDFLNYSRGDRIGHGLALGLDPNEFYYKKRYQVTTYLQEHIDNMAWMYYIFTNFLVEDNIYLSILENQFYKSINLLLPEFTTKLSYNIVDYSQSLFLRGDNRSYYTSYEKIKEIRDYSNSDFATNISGYFDIVENQKAKILHHHYIYDEKLMQRGSKIIEYDVTEDWINMVTSIQEYLKDKISKKGIFIESNPTSNRKISSISHYTDLPLLKMNSFQLTQEVHKSIPVTLNTDDGAIFQTNLSNEYSLIAAGLERDGYDTEHIYRYIDYLREMSKSSIFF